jgi:hypothetical protein
MNVLAWLQHPWPWYVSGPLIGLMVPGLLLIGNKDFGISSSLRHTCAAFGARFPLFRYDWRREGGWNLLLALGVVLGGTLAGTLLADPQPLVVAASTRHDLAALGVGTSGGLAPASLFGWRAMVSLPSLLLLAGGGFLVGFGARYAGGCTSGHAITGLSHLQRASFVSVLGFFAGGLVMTHLLLPLVLGL